jgi:hypothetical protein
MWTLNGRVIREGRSFIDDNGVKHPASWGTYEASYKASIGLVEVAVQAKPDARFYWVTGPDTTGAYTSTPRELEDRNEVDENGDPLLDADGVQIVTKGLKSQWIARTKETQGSLLAQTDWAYIRKTDTGIAVPVGIQTYRDEVRLAAGTIEGQIAACADLAAFKALFDAPTDADGNVTGNAPIHNWPARQF